MRYTTDDRGVMNNFAVEPTMYLAEEPSKKQQIRYAIQGGLALILVGSLIAITLVVS
jgi:hypothetical protein